MAIVLTTIERIQKAKLELIDQRPFWAFLISKMNIKKDETGILKKMGGGMGVSYNAEVIYDEDFVSKLTIGQIKYVLAHECGHLFLNHLIRCGNRQHKIFNYCGDLAINTLLDMNDFNERPKDGIFRDKYSDTFKANEHIIINVSKKCAEEFYEEWPIDNSQKTFDVHFEPDANADPGKVQQISEKWKDAVIEAATYAKQRGLLPNGMDALIGEITNPKINWKQLLKKEITNILPNDYSFSRPSRKFSHVIMPGCIKETIEIVSHIDTSGSITDKQINQFVSENVGMVRAFNNIRLTLIMCDCEIQEVIEIKGKEFGKLTNLRVRSRGGTSHLPVVDYLLKNKKNVKLLISLTDGYSDIEQCFPKLKCNKILVLTNDNVALHKYAKCCVIKDD